MVQCMIGHVAAIALAVALTVSTARGNPEQPMTAPAFRDAPLDAVVEAWAQQSSQIKSLSAKFTRIGKGLGANEYRYQLQWSDSGQANLEIAQVARNNHAEAFSRFVWTGKQVWEYRAYSKEVVVWTTNDVRDYDEFRKIVKGSLTGRIFSSQLELIFPTMSDPKDVDPLPFLINMKDNVAKRRFKFEPLDSPDPAKVVLRATPLEKELKLSYDSVTITLDRDRALPVAIVYHKGRLERNAIRYTFSEITIDPAIDPARFEPQIPKGWKVKSPKSTDS
jgi:outer membrane lipoprotein-sorting protein